MAEEVNFSSNQKLTTDEAMQLAIRVAREGAPYVSPNPLVGCVILDEDNHLLATGFHKKYGSSHAEIDALEKIDVTHYKNLQVVVTLEPCAHQGKTPSCAKTLAQLNRHIKKVVYGLVDPNPLVAGQGAQILKEAGIEADEYHGPHQKELENLAEIFLKNFRHKKIFVAAKIASSLDGVIALKTGESQWITTAQSREYVHELRSHYDAIIVGRNTIEIDDPSLNIRHPKITKENKLIILDSKASLYKKIQAGAKYKFLDCHKTENVFYATKVSGTDNPAVVQHTDLKNLLSTLWEKGIRSVFIEGGAETYSSFLSEKLIDRLHLFLNTSVIGQKNGLSWANGLQIPNLESKQSYDLQSSHIFGSDLYLNLKFKI